jgi:hypothetical protein
MPGWADPITRTTWPLIIASLYLASLAACVSVEYPVPGTPIKPRPGEALVFSHVRLFDD